MGSDKKDKPKPQKKDKKPTPFRNGTILGLIVGVALGLIVGWATPGLAPGFVDQGKQKAVDKVREVEGKARHRVADELESGSDKMREGARNVREDDQKTSDALEGEEKK